MNRQFWIHGLFVVALVATPAISFAQDAAQAKRDLCQKQLSQVRDELRQVSQVLLELIDKHGTLVISREKILEEMSSLEEEGWGSQVEREQAQIRSEVLRERLKKLVAEAKEEEVKDEVATLLEKKLAIAQAKRTRVNLLHENGTAPESEVEDAEALVTDAQLALAQHREERKQGSAAEDIKSISRELAEIESDLIVKERTSSIYEKRIAILKASLLKTAEYSDLERTEASLQRKREHWEDTLLQLETEEFDLSVSPKSKNEEEDK